MSDKAEVRFGHSAGYGRARAVGSGAVVRADQTATCPPHHWVLVSEGGRLTGSCKKCPRTYETSVAGDMETWGTYTKDTHAATGRLRRKRPARTEEDESPIDDWLTQRGFHLDG